MTTQLAFYLILAFLIIYFVFLLNKYRKGLKKSPMDLWFLFVYKIAEYSVYNSINLALVLWLSKDIGLNDITAGMVISLWSISLSFMVMLSGSIIDTIGMKKTLMLSIYLTVFSRIICSFITHPLLVFIFGMLPMGIGLAIVSPLVSVGIKRYTTNEGAALGFGLFYVFMNVGYSIGGLFLDWIRSYFALRDSSGKIIDENFGTILLGWHFSTYQMIFLLGIGGTLVSYISSFFIRDIKLNESDQFDQISIQSTQTSFWGSITSTAKNTWNHLASISRDKYFWIYIGMIGILVMIKSGFIHFHYTFPKYAVRVLGEGAKVGTLWGFLNPIFVVLFVPLITTLSKGVKSYSMLIIGTFISASSFAIAILPVSWWEPLTSTFFGELVFTHLLKVNNPPPLYWSLILMIFLFTLGEAIWSPRLMQFTVEIAPPGKEGSYIALSSLPFFLAKFFVGPFSGWLVQTYTPLDANGKILSSYPDHFYIWIWIGAIGFFTPLGLLYFRSTFLNPPIPKESP